MERRYILQFVCYSPRIYSGLDKFFVLLTKKLQAQGITPVFIYSDSLEAVPQIQKDLEAAGGIVEIMPSHGKLTMIRYIHRFYHKYHPEVVDVHFVPYVKAWAALFSKLYGIKHVNHIHSLIASVHPNEYVKQKGFLKRFLLGINSAFLNNCGKVICVSKAIEKQFNEWAYGDKRNVTTLYLGTDLTPSKLTKQQAREKLGLSQEKIIITNISAIEQIKGIDIVIKAIAILKRRKVDVFFAHIGGLRSNSQVNIDYSETLRMLSKEEEVADRVFWLGKRFDIQDILIAFDIYVHPSRSEGLGCTLMEASVAGLPLVGSRVGGIPEVVIDKENGYIVESENADQLASAIQNIVENETLRTKFGQVAKKRVYAHFDMDKQTNELIEEYGI